MGESAMRQGMETWLKKECVDTGKGMLIDRKLIASIRERVIFEGHYDTAEALADKLESSMRFHARKGYIGPELPSIVHNKILDIINNLRGDGDFGDAVRKFEGLTDEADLRLFESVVECQCGKPGVQPKEEYAPPTMKFPEADFEWWRLGEKVKSEDESLKSEVDDKVHDIVYNTPDSDDAKRWLVAKAGEIGIKEY